MSAWNFWAVVEFYRNHYGNCFVYIDTVKSGRGSGKIKGLYVLENKNIQIWIDDAGLVSNKNAIWYIHTDSKGKEYKLSHDQVLHFRTAISLDGITGLAIQDILKTSIENSQSGQKFINNYFKNGLMAGGLLQYTGDIDEKAMKKMRSKFEAMASGLENAHKILPVPLPFSFQTLSNKLVDSQFLELSQYSAKQIAAVFGIKNNQLNEQVKYQNMELQQKEFYIDTLLTTLTMYEQELSYKLLTERERNEGMFFKFNVDFILRGTFKERMEGYATAINNGVMKPSEARDKEDLPFDDDSDKLIVNGNFIPLSMVGQQYVKPAEGGDDSE